MSKYILQGASINIASEAPDVHEIGIGLGWEKRSGHAKFDLDVSVFMLNRFEKLPSEEHFVYFGNLKSPHDAVIHSGDERSGSLKGDDEMIMVNLSNIPREITDVLFVASIYDAEIKKQHFGQLVTAYIRVFNQKDQLELIRYDLDKELKFQTTGEFGRLKRKNNDWEFVATGKGEFGGLQTLREIYT
ncbi:MAG: tellurium resistance protein TerD [Flammeovirgaceae bacterium]|jgi:tellurium resistance protein TerD